MDLFQVKLGYMYNFTLGMLFAVTAMAYTYMFVPESIPIREARLAKQRQAEGKMEGKYHILHDFSKNIKIQIIC